jgi:subtilase-type serine protease
MYAQIQAQGVRAINHSWGISTRNMTAAALDAQYAASVPATACTAASTRTVRTPRFAVDPGLVGRQWQRRGRRYHRGPAALEAGDRAYWLAVANVRQPNAANGETDYVINAGSSICGAAANWCISAPGTAILSTIVSGDIQGRWRRPQTTSVFSSTARIPRTTTA